MTAAPLMLRLRCDQAELEHAEILGGGERDEAVTHACDVRMHLALEDPRRLRWKVQAELLRIERVGVVWAVPHAAASASDELPRLGHR